MSTDNPDSQPTPEPTDSPLDGEEKPTLPDRVVRQVYDDGSITLRDDRTGVIVTTHYRDKWTQRLTDKWPWSVTAAYEQRTAYQAAVDSQSHAEVTAYRVMDRLIDRYE
jgi:hypothetical protein